MARLTSRLTCTKSEGPNSSVTRPPSTAYREAVRPSASGLNGCRGLPAGCGFARRGARRSARAGRHRRPYRGCMMRNTSAARSSPGGELHLRDALADAQGLDQRRELLGKRREAFDENLAAAQIRKIGFVALAKARKDAALLMHVLDAEPRPAPIGKCGPAQRLDHPRRSNAADALEVVEQLALFRGELRLGRQVLQASSRRTHRNARSAASRGRAKPSGCRAALPPRTGGGA